MQISSQSIAKPASKSSALKAIKNFGSSWITVGLLAGGITAAIALTPSSNDKFTKSQDTTTLDSGKSPKEEINACVMASVFSGPLSGFYRGKCQAQNSSK